jgi:hypothetical protein
MFIITTIEYGVVVMIGFYLIVTAIVWIYELRKSAVYRKMKEQIRCLENFHLSMAVSNAKAYRIMENYRRDILGIEKIQQFIFENLFFISKGSQRNVPNCGVIDIWAVR